MPLPVLRRCVPMRLPGRGSCLRVVTGSPPEGEDTPTGSPRTCSGWKRGRERNAMAWRGDGPAPRRGPRPLLRGRWPVLERTESPPLLPEWPFHACASTFELAQPVRDLPTGSVYLHGPQGGDEVLKSLWKKTSFRCGVRAQCSDPAAQFRMLPCFPGDYRFPPSTRYSHLFTPSTLTPQK